MGCTTWGSWWMTHEGQGYKLMHVNREGLTPTNALRKVDGWIAG